jgi:hypothetical protein
MVKAEYLKWFHFIESLLLSDSFIAGVGIGAMDR